MAVIVDTATETAQYELNLEKYQHRECFINKKDGV